MIEKMIRSVRSLALGVAAFAGVLDHADDGLLNSGELHIVALVALIAHALVVGIDAAEDKN